MAINSISSPALASPPAMTAAPAKMVSMEATEAVRGGRDMQADNDADDSLSGTGYNPHASGPTTNGMGQKIGTTLNVQA